MNIQKVAGAGWEMYLAKYVAKTEPSFSVDVSRDASEPEKYLRTRIVGQLEVQHIILGHFLCCSSREVIFLPTDLNPQYGFLKRKQHLPEDPNSKDIYYDNYLEKYMDRPAELENVLYKDWASKYTICKYNAKSDNADDESDDENEEKSKPDNKVLYDKQGRKWKLRKKEAIPRWKFFLPNGLNQEQYYMQKLVFSLPLRRDTQVISEGNESQTYMEECTIRGLFDKEGDALDSLHSAHQRGFSIKRLRSMAQQFVQMDWIGKDEFNTFIDEVDTLPSNTNEKVQEVTEIDTTIDESDLADLHVKAEQHFDLQDYKKHSQMHKIWLMKFCYVSF